MTRMRAWAGPLAAVLLLAAAPSAVAGQGDGDIPAPPSTSIESQVQVTISTGGGTQHLTAGGTGWVPPACWLEPRWTAEQYQHYWEDEILPAAGSFGQYIYPQYEALKAADFNKGKDGLWWGIVFANRAWDLPNYADCFKNTSDTWVPTGKPPAGVPAVTPELLSKIAYSATKLPDVQVGLSPAADQVVNLPTYVKLSTAVAPVSVTAQLNVMGVHVAASTLAVPESLQVDAGTDDASPRSCTYPMVRSGGGYQVDSSGASCNITYRRATYATGRHQLTGRVLWRVTWSATADPNGPVAGQLPDGSSGSTPIDVKVNEIQTVVTG